MIILGAGMAGCLAGILNPRAVIFEAEEGQPNNHKAVLRFRDDKISKVSGVEFKKVKVQKAIWFEGKESSPTPRICNFYSQKVSNRLLSRSINNVDSVYRYVAPDDFHIQLADQCKGRINYGAVVEKINNDFLELKGLSTAVMRNRNPILSTIPMPIMLKIIGIEHNLKFNFSPITVKTFKVKGSDVFQTIYYPDLNTSVYRATMTGEDLIVESVGDITDEDLGEIKCSFGFSSIEFDSIGETKQKYGKIAPIDDTLRKHFMFTLSSDYGIYSLGRFACWRNILLDDVYDDFYKIKRMILTTSKYDHKLEALT